MNIPTLNTVRLVLKQLTLDDAPQIQKIYPKWEIVKFMSSGTPWPFPENGAENFIKNSALPDMSKGFGWFWTIRTKSSPEKVIGLICLNDRENDNRGFWLSLEYQGQGYMREASIAATDYWFNTLNKTVLRVPKAAKNIRSKNISTGSGMRLIATGKKEYVSGLLDSELWEITRDEWNKIRLP